MDWEIPANVFMECCAFPFSCLSEFVVVIILN